MLYNCLSWYKFVNTHLYHSRQLYNIQLLVASAGVWWRCLAISFNSIGNKDSVRLIKFTNDVIMSVALNVFRALAMLEVKLRAYSIKQSGFGYTLNLDLVKNSILLTNLNPDSV